MADNVNFERLTADGLSKAFADLQAVRLMLAVVLGELASNKENDAEAAKFLESRKNYLYQILDQALSSVDNPDEEYISRIKETIHVTFESIHVGRTKA
ncbi:MULTISPECIES: hypothetical protein [unclassified Methylobacterium]|jgi:hypothetical protein|uniref:hypothetical protein n=1 Tax=unclassified Methylobacterium TaxID=2615210 RepID=UPI0008E19F77|nr:MULTISPECIES: hypothetical protein [unclassified Methylobacterium]SFU67706.1 hypothetical protein SAMN02799643_01756 [Methylobacterium sp. UNCCL125]